MTDKQYDVLKNAIQEKMNGIEILMYISHEIENDNIIDRLHISNNGIITYRLYGARNCYQITIDIIKKIYHSEFYDPEKHFKDFESLSNALPDATNQPNQESVITKIPIDRKEITQAIDQWKEDGGEKKVSIKSTLAADTGKIKEAAQKMAHLIANSAVVVAFPAIKEYIKQADEQLKEEAEKKALKILQDECKQPITINMLRPDMLIRIKPLEEAKNCKYVPMCYAHLFDKIIEIEHVRSHYVTPKKNHGIIFPDMIAEIIEEKAPSVSVNINTPFLGFTKKETVQKMAKKIRDIINKVNDQDYPRISQNGIQNPASATHWIHIKETEQKNIAQVQEINSSEIVDKIIDEWPEWKKEIVHGKNEYTDHAKPGSDKTAIIKYNAGYIPPETSIEEWINDDPETVPKETDKPKTMRDLFTQQQLCDSLAVVKHIKGLEYERLFSSCEKIEYIIESNIDLPY